jgi:hypothetical protein
MHKSVVITGIGVVTNLGQNVVDFWENCLAGRSIIEPIPQSWQFYSKYHSGIWSPLGEVNFKAKGFSDVELLQRDPVSLLAMDAAQQALADAGFTCILTNPKKTSIKLKVFLPTDVEFSLEQALEGQKLFWRTMPIKYLPVIKIFMLQKMGKACCLALHAPIHL